MNSSKIYSLTKTASLARGCWRIKGTPLIVFNLEYSFPWIAKGPWRIAFCSREEYANDPYQENETISQNYRKEKDQLTKWLEDNFLTQDFKRRSDALAALKLAADTNNPPIKLI